MIGIPHGLLTANALPLRLLGFGPLRRVRSQIYVMDADGGRISINLSDNVLFILIDWHPSWSPDGKRIAFDFSVGMGQVGNLRNGCQWQVISS